MDQAPSVNRLRVPGEGAEPKLVVPAHSGATFRLILFGSVAVVSVFFGFLAHDVGEARGLVQRYGYYVMAFTVGWTAIIGWMQLSAWRKVEPHDWTKREMLGVLGLISVLTLLAIATSPSTYKVLYDEFVLQNTALSLHHLREVGTTVRAYEVEGSFISVGTYLDKRPFFFAFLLSLLHDFFGYREANAFYLNAALMPVVLGLLYLVARRLASPAAASACVVAFGAFSLLAHNATGAGMEMLNLAMLLLTVWLSIRYLEAPTEGALSLLVLSSVLLAQSRYESSLYIGPAALVVIEGWRRAGRVMLPTAAVLAPALLIPYALHNTYLSGTPALWELREGLETRFGFQYLFDNLEHARLFFFDFSAVLPNSWWLAFAGFPALGWLLFRVVRAVPGWKKSTGAGFAVTVFGLFIAANLGLLMFYYWGQLDDPIVARLSLPFSVLLVLAMARVVVEFPANAQRTVALLVAGGGLFSYFSTGIRANANNADQNLLMNEIRWEGRMIEDLPPASRLIISNKSPLYWIAREIPSLPIARARWRGEGIKFHLDHHTFSEVLVTQIYRPVGAGGGFQLEPEDRLPDTFVLEPWIERRFGSRIARISRVVAIRLDPAATPAANVAARP